MTKDISHDDTETQDDIIQSIKRIATQIFDHNFENFTFLTHNSIYHFQLFDGQSLQDPSQSHNQKGIPLRFSNNDKQQCRSEWITYEDLQESMGVNKYFGGAEMTTEGNRIKYIEKNRKKQQKQGHRCSRNCSDRIQASSENERMKTAKTGQIKIELVRLQSYGFMKKKSKVNPQVLSTIYKQKEESQNKSTPNMKKAYKSLEQLYQEKLPLYEKYLMEKEKKMTAIFQSRLSQQSKELSELILKPETNKNIEVKGNFEERMKKNMKKSRENQTRIINDVLKSTPFHPQISKPNKYHHVDSRVKKNWQGQSRQKQQLKPKRPSLVGQEIPRFGYLLQSPGQLEKSLATEENPLFQY